jgi:hypothetical protein
MAEKHNVGAIAGGRSIALWAGVIGAPAAWGVQLVIGYAFSQRACNGNGHGTMHAITAAFAILAMTGAFLSWRDWKKAGGGSPDNADGGPVARDRFLGGLGMALGILSTIVVVAQGIASFYFDGCWN